MDMEEHHKKDLIEGMKKIKETIVTTNFGPIRIVESPMLPDGIVLVSTKVFNLLKDNKQV